MAELVKTCRLTGVPFVVTEWEGDLLRKMAMPLPTLCIDERQRRRLSYRNERKIYKRTCDFTGKTIVSVYSPDKQLTVYSPEAWWSDDWDPYPYGREFDFTRSFFEQFQELRLVVPRLALVNIQGENSEYCHNTLGNKNCYLLFGGDYNEDSYYGILNMHSRDSYDLYWVNQSELTYDSIDCHGCYHLLYSQNAYGCSDSSFLFECRDCDHCTACVGLRNKSYHIFNEPYSPEQYMETLKSFRLETWSGVQALRDQFAGFKLRFPHRFAHIVSSEDVTGDYISHAKNCLNCFDIEGPVRDCKDVIYSGWENSKDLLSSNNVGVRAEMYYEMAYSNQGRNCAFCLYSWASNETVYCDTVMYSHYLFGCVGLKRAEYCIFNKPYTKHEYHQLRARIIEHMKETGEWGEFFPMEHSPWCYNETAAQDFYPLARDEALGLGLCWYDEERREPGAGPAIPDSINDVLDEITGQLLVCEKTGQPYKILGQELSFYRRMGIPLPRYAPETRHKIRLKMRNPLRTWKRKCQKCSAPIITTYAPSRPEIVYCEPCYLERVY